MILSLFSLLNSWTRLFVDCANGASYLSAPIVFWELGAEVIQIGVKPDGLNINEECGSTDTKLLSEKVKKNKAISPFT